MLKQLLGLTILFNLAIPAFNQISSPAIYHDGHGEFVYFSAGKISFADAVVSQTDGDKMPPQNGGPVEIVLDEPNYDIERSQGFFTLGCGGSITVRFIDNALVDIDGPDLYVFELGSIVEATKLEISNDGKTWINVGEINGGRAEVDIHDFVQPEDVFYYVRLTDLRTGCIGLFAGADIDAIAAIGSVAQVNLSGSVLFESGSYTLRKDALNVLDKLVVDLNATAIKSIEIQGHTDSDGSDDANITLSKNRANSVKIYLSGKLKDKSIKFNIKGFGESQPVADNATEDGKQQNRRVSLIVHPKEVTAINKKQYEELTNIVYVKCNVDSTKWYNGHPKPVNKVNFSWMDMDHIDDILYYNGYSYYFNGSKMRIYNHQTGKEEPTTSKVSDLFAGVNLDRIDVSFYLPGEDKICFCKRDSCYLYNPKTRKAKFYMLMDLFPGLKTTTPEAVMYIGEDLYFFFFQGNMQLYDWKSKMPYKKPGTISDVSTYYPLFVGSPLWFSGPDALLDDYQGNIYFFKNPH